LKKNCKQLAYTYLKCWKRWFKEGGCADVNCVRDGQMGDGRIGQMTVRYLRMTVAELELQGGGGVIWVI
jgi:hypothetical protein